MVEYEALPQRPPRTRKRRRDRKDVLDESIDVKSDTNAPLLSGEENTRLVPSVDGTGENEVKGGTVTGDDATPEYRSDAVEGYNFEYLDHTADVQLHAWGKTMEEALENVGLCMFNYMTPLAGISCSEERKFAAHGHDMKSLIFHWLDELLFQFSTDFFVPKTLKITKLKRESSQESTECPKLNSDFEEAGKNDKEKADKMGKQWLIEAVGVGEKFDRTRHVSGTEIKAITYSAMQINEDIEDSEVFVIVDI